MGRNPGKYSVQKNLPPENRQDGNSTRNGPWVAAKVSAHTVV